MTSDITDIQKILENLEKINKKKQTLEEVLHTIIVRQENHTLYLNTIIRDLAARLHTTADFKVKLETENRILRRKLRRLEEERQSSLRQ